MVEIRRWELSERGNYDARAVTRSITDNWISVPSEGSYIYEVKASWPRGEISYVFEFGLAPEDIRLELGDLPANYTVDTAVTSGDVVIAPYGHIWNEDRLYAFIEKTNIGAPGFIRIAVFEENDGPYLYDLDFDGARIVCESDNTRVKLVAAAQRGISRRTYDYIAVEEQYSKQYGYSLAYIRLASGTGAKMTVAQFMPVSMETEQAQYSEGTERLKVSIENHTGGEMTYGVAFALELLEDGSWTPVVFDAPFDDWEETVVPGGMAACEVPLSAVGDWLMPGDYRVVKLVSIRQRDTVRTLRMSAPFSIAAAGEPLQLRRPQRIGVFIGNGEYITAATLTTRLRYDGQSSIGFLMDELGNFRALPSDWEMKSSVQTAGGILTFAFSDQTEQKLYLEPQVNRIMEDGSVVPLTVLTNGERRYYADADAYDRILECTAAAGGRVLSHDAPCPSAAAWLAESWGLPVSLFVQQEGERARLYFFDRRGMPLGRARERWLEGALLRSELRRMPAGRVGQWESVTGVRPAYAADAAKRSQVTQAPLRRLEVAVPGREPADGALAEALERLGCTVRREASPGVPAFRTGRGGFRLLAEDEEGEPLPPEQLLTIVALIEYEDGAGRVAVPDAAPAAIDTLAAGYHGGALRLGRDGPEAEARYGELPWLRDALFAACRICAHLGMTGERLHGLAGKIPRFVLRRREVSLRSGQGEVLSVLLRTLPGAQPAGGGLRLRQGEGWVTLVPLAHSAVLRIVGEARSAELAEELCAFCARRAEEADRGLPEK